MKLIIDIEPRYCKDMDSDVKELYYEAINRITEAVRNGMPYEETSQGKWIKHDTWDYSCSICGISTSVDDGIVEDLPNFCPNCGTKMKGGEVRNDSGRNA